MKPHAISDEQLIAFAADELGGDAVVALEAHIASCTRCTKMVARFKRVRTILRDDDTHTPPGHVLAKAYSIFPRPKPKPTGLLFFLTSHPFQSFASAAFAMLILVCGIMYGIGQMDLPAEDTLYPVKSVVQGVESAVSDTWRSLGGSLAPALPTPKITPTRTITPTPIPTSVSATATLVVPLNAPFILTPPPPAQDPNSAPSQRTPANPAPVATPPSSGPDPNPASQRTPANPAPVATPPSSGPDPNPASQRTPANPTSTSGSPGRGQPIPTQGVIERAKPTNTPHKADLMPNITPTLRDATPSNQKDDQNNSDNASENQNADPAQGAKSPNEKCDKK